MQSGWYVCAECGKNFYRTKNSGPAPTYCSFDCRRKPYDRRIREQKRSEAKQRREKLSIERTRICPVCGKSFVWTSLNRDQVYCSRNCSGLKPNSSWFPRKYPITEILEREKLRRKKRHERISKGEPVNRQAIFERDGWICQLCGKPVDPELKWPNVMSASVDHIRPLSLGGKHTTENVQLTHLGCNSRKSAAHDWMERQLNMNGTPQKINVPGMHYLPFPCGNFRSNTG